MKGSTIACKTIGYISCGISWI